MGKVRKSAGTRHEATLSQGLSEFIKTATSIPVDKLPSYLRTLPSPWPYPRGDLYHWISVLDRFDGILEDFCDEYDLKKGPQTGNFENRLLAKYLKLTDTDTLLENGFSAEGDRELVEEILSFTCLLLEKCGNRGLYSSSSLLDDLLNTHSLTLLEATLRLCLHLAQRYHASRTRLGSVSQNAGLLVSHYNINLEKINKIASPFVKDLSLSPQSVSSGKVKEGYDNNSVQPESKSHPADLIAMTKPNSDESADWAQFLRVSLRYYHSSVKGQVRSATDQSKSQDLPFESATNRRNVTSSSRHARQSLPDPSATSSDISGTNYSPENSSTGSKTLHLPPSLVASTSSSDLMARFLPMLPSDVHFDFLTRIRTSKGIGSNLADRQKVVQIRMLAVANLAYVYPESTFQQRIAQIDSEEPRRFQLPYQLAEILQPIAPGGAEILKQLQTSALYTLEALTRQKSKAADVTSALNIGVSHGILSYVLQKAVKEINLKEGEVEKDDFEWRNALFALIMSLPNSGPRAGESLVSAGLVKSFTEILRGPLFRTERHIQDVLTFLDVYVYNIRNAFQALVNSDGLNILADTIVQYVDTAFTLAENGLGMPEAFKTQMTDFKIPFYSQQNLRWLLKFTNHMLSHGGGNSDRLLRNLVSSPKLLGALRIVIENAKIYGSNIWVGSVNVMVNFIHNEPTSYAIFAEAGISEAILNTISISGVADASLPAPHNNRPSNQPDNCQERPLSEKADRLPRSTTLEGILPSAEAITVIPQIFGAICLIESGMNLFQASKALQTFFGIFISEKHMKALNSDQDVAATLGTSFDELVRHHPQLKSAVLDSVENMVSRVTSFCFEEAASKGSGAKMWLETDEGKLLVAGGTKSLKGEEGDLHKRAQLAKGKASDANEPFHETIPFETSKEFENSIAWRQDLIESTDKELQPLPCVFNACRFLKGFFGNSSLCGTFIERGSFENIFDLATLPFWPPNFRDDITAGDSMATLIQVLIEQKPHLVLPELIRRLRLFLDRLDPFLKQDGPHTYLSKFTHNSKSQSSPENLDPSQLQGTRIAKALVTVTMLCTALGIAFQEPVFQPRSSNSLFTQVNLTDMYIGIIDKLGALYQSCIIEELKLQHGTFLSSTDGPRAKVSEAKNMDKSDVSSILAGISIPGTGQNDRSNLSAAAMPSTELGLDRKYSSKDDDREMSAKTLNTKTLRQLLSQVANSIMVFFQGIGKSLLLKRTLDSYQRYIAHLVASHLARTYFETLKNLKEYKYSGIPSKVACWTAILSSITGAMTDNIAFNRSHPHLLTIVLQWFKNYGGFTILAEMLEDLRNDFEKTVSIPHDNNESETEKLRQLIVTAIDFILTFFSHSVNSKSISEASQTLAMASRSERDKDKPDYFVPAQFLVELRQSVLRPVEKLWNHDKFVERADRSTLKSIIDILRLILEGEAENGAFKKPDKFLTRNRHQPKAWKLRNLELLSRLVNDGYEEELAKEALYRCNESYSFARDYCSLRRSDSRASRFPIPKEERQLSMTSHDVSSQLSEEPVRLLPSREELVDGVHQHGQDNASERNTEHQIVNSQPSFARALSILPGELASSVQPDNAYGDNTQAIGVHTNLRTNSEEMRPDGFEERYSFVVTVDDLDEEREKTKKSLIDRCLDTLSSHDFVTFELSDLISAALSKANDPAAMRQEIGETLVQSLMSLQSADDLLVVSKKIAAYAHFLAILLQDKEFFQASVHELRANFSSLLEFVRWLPPKSAQGESSLTWIAKVLLVVERLLAEDAQPDQVVWNPPQADGSEPESTLILQLAPQLANQPMRQKLFENILVILPHVGKDETLAWSIIRSLVILTRDRAIAAQLGEKKNMQKLFLMVKQLAGFSSERLQASFLLVLRHIVEDQSTISRIMKTEIEALFESRQQRQIETTSYIRQLYHLVLRCPELFIECTSELLAIQRYDPNQRPQMLTLKKSVEAAGDDKVKESTDGSVDELGVGQNGKEEQLPKPIINNPKESYKAQDTKPPIIENPAGVVHYLLCELLSYKDVIDKEPTLAAYSQDHTSSSNQPGIQMGIEGNMEPASTSLLPRNSNEKGFKADEHPIYMYRCFILHCLTELLACCNRTKLEFISFSRKADPQVKTPTKPHSRVLDYLLNTLIPVGSLDNKEDINFKKKTATSTWAMSVVVSLCAKTSEQSLKKSDDEKAFIDNAELQFVRKFVLEYALRTFRDVTFSSEPLEQKYSKILNLGDLFNRMLTGKNNSSFLPDVGEKPSDLARLMIEKHFIATLSTCLGEIDLSFPGSRRAIKYILRPLKTLTKAALDMNLSSDVEVPSAGIEEDNDDISTASSVSDIEESREETPDLFRHSTLGMFEPTRDDDTESDDGDDEDEEMVYEDEYGDEMDYEEEELQEHADVVSEEDEEIDGIGPIEGLPGDVDVQVVIQRDEMSTDEDDVEEDLDEADEDIREEDDIEIMDVVGENEDRSVFSGDEEEWVSEEDENVESFNGQHASQNSASRAHGDVIDHIVRVVESEGTERLLERFDDAELDLDIGPDDLVDDEVADDNDDEEDEEDDDYDEGDVTYEPEFEDDESGMHNMIWGHSFMRGHNHHRSRDHRWNAMLSGGSHDHSMFLPTYRSPRHSNNQRDDGMNPLLLRTGGEGSSSRNRNTEPLEDWMDTIRSTARVLPGSQGPMSFLSTIISAMSRGVTPGNHRQLDNGGLQFTISRLPFGNSHEDDNLPQGLLGLIPPLGARRSPDPSHRAPREDPAQAVAFVPAVTTTRWQDEARLLFGNNYIERAQRVINSILKIMVPPAIEAQKLLKLRLEEKLKEEQLAKEKEKVEFEGAERRKEAERAEQAEKLERDVADSEAGRPQIAEDRQLPREDDGNAIEHNMEGVEGSDVSNAQGPSESTSASRVTTRIRGRDLDITGLGIDLGYLEALPEEFREEVLMQQVAEQRSQAVAAGQEPTDISREFLEALPPEIRNELLQQEAQDRRRREREEARQRASNEGLPAQAEDMDAASFLASLDPGLRQSVLMEQDEEMLAHLPDSIAAEARALGGDRRQNPFRGIGRLGRNRNEEQQNISGQHLQKKHSRKQVPQLLDKSGVATVLRLMFMPLQGSSRQSVNEVLKDICENRHNRAEVISLLLTILQDAGTDKGAAERSYTHLTQRARNKDLQKSLQPRKTSFCQTSDITDISPLLVVQQCISTLLYLTLNNAHTGGFFLSEHEMVNNSKARVARKGKGKENKFSKYPLNALLALLDRKMIVESASTMEQLAGLVNTITLPLSILLRKELDKTKLDENKDKMKPEISSALHGGEISIDNNANDGMMTTVTNSAGPSQEVHSEVSQSITGPSRNGSSDRKTKNDELEQVDKPKKNRALRPPEVPEENLRLVINILTARECTSKTFRDTLSMILNLSALPGAKDIFGRELICKAQNLAECLLKDLDDLSAQILQPESGTDIQGLALSKFSPATSNQSKLLRVLTALDYLFDPRRPDLLKSMNNDSDDDFCTTIHSALESSQIFNSLWKKLSDTLTAVREHGNLFSVATILLPMIEALMVVCKNTTLRTPLSSKSKTKDQLPSSPKSNTQIENLFFSFTEDHRRVLNDLVRHNPKLMSGWFSLLVKNSKVLEFDNKRNYFTRKLHSRNNDTRHQHSSLQLAVRREQVFLDSFKSLYFKSADEMKYGKLNIRFHGEEGVDAGGVTREWFQVLSRQMFNPDYALFIPVASDRTTFHPNRLSSINQEHLMFFKFIGRIIGKALYEGRVLDCHFSRAVYKRILGKPVSVKDMETLDLDYYKSLLWMLENDITDIITETFSLETEAFGVSQIVDLIENGRNVPVTEENKHEYVRLVVEYRLTGSVQEQLENFLRGFHDIISPELVAIFNEQELELLISGLPDIDVDDWKNNTEYQNFSAASPQIQWFWRAVRSFDKEERAKLLQFVTGTSKVPLNGFKDLEGMNGISRFNIHRDYGSKDRLPSSHTCFNQMDLPEYDSYDSLRKALYTAMTAGSEYFGFA